jgi:hypothetical protein
LLLTALLSTRDIIQLLITSSPHFFLLIISLLSYPSTFHSFPFLLSSLSSVLASLFSVSSVCSSPSIVLLFHPLLLQYFDIPLQLWVQSLGGFPLGGSEPRPVDTELMRFACLPVVTEFDAIIGLTF